MIKIIIENKTIYNTHLGVKFILRSKMPFVFYQYDKDLPFYECKDYSN